MDKETIVSWTERELIENIYHELNQSSTSARGWIEILVNGELGFSNSKQKEILEYLHQSIRNIAEVNNWVGSWILSRKKED